VIRETVGRLLQPRKLSLTEVRGIFDELVAPGATDAERAAILVGLASRAETAEEVAAFALEMRRRARPFRLSKGDRTIDLCGSGGAPRPSFNVSTVSAFVVAASGTPVVKHGNRSARGLCGSSDLLEALGLPVTTSMAYSLASYRKFRLSFLHAPLFHPATRAVVPVRKLLGIPTVFNRLGPLSNPARVPFQVVGMPNLSAARLTAAVLPRLGVVRGLAMTSADGCDEFSPRALTTAIVWTKRRRTRFELDPTEHLPSEDRRGDWGTLPPVRAAAEAERILAGGGGARRGSVLLTAGAALWIVGEVPTFRQGVERAREALDDGRAERLLHRMQGLAPRFRPRAGA
jgi:anthranilate phosphoribosyltransferase